MKRIPLIATVLLASTPLFASDSALLLSQDATWAEAAWSPAWESANDAIATVTTDAAAPLVLSLDSPVTLKTFNLLGNADLTLAGTALLTGSGTSTFTIPSGRALEIQAPLEWNTTGISVGAGQTLIFSGANTKTFTGAAPSKTGLIQVAGADGKIEFKDCTATLNGGSGFGFRFGAPGEIRFSGNTDLSVSASGSAFISQGSSYNTTTKKKGTYYLTDNAKITVTGGPFYLAATEANSQSDFTQTGGELIINSSSTFRLAHDSSGSAVPAVYTLDDGILNLVNTSTTLEIARAGAADFIVNGGQVTASGITVTMSGTNKGRALLRGGTITLTGTAGITSSSSTVGAYATLELGATTLKTSGNSWPIGSIGTFTLSDTETGARFEPEAEKTITISSAMSGQGKLVVNGPGTVKLNAANTCTGATELTGGTLLVSNAGGLSPSSDLTVTGGTLSVGAGTAITATPKSLTIGNATIAINPVSESGSGIQIQGGEFNVTAQTTLALTFGTAGVGRYPLITGFTGGNASIYDLNPTTDLTAAFICTLAIEEGSLIAIVSPATSELSWKPQSVGTWSTDAADKNWLNLKTSLDQAFANDDFVTFGDLSGIPAATVNVSGEVIPSDITFANPATAYTFSAGNDSKVTIGTKALVTAEQGLPVVFEAPVEISGGITASAGSALTLSAPFGNTANALYNGALEVQADATLTIKADTAQTVSTAFTGSGTIAKTGSAGVTFGTAQSGFTGQIRVEQSTLTLNANSFFKNTAYQADGAYPLVIENGATVILSGQAIATSSNMYGSNFAILKEGATLKHNSTDQNQRNRIRIEGNASLINGGGYEWAVHGGAAFEITAGKTSYSIDPGATGNGPKFNISTTSSGFSDAVDFEIATGAEFSFAGNVNVQATGTFGLRKTGGGTLTFESGTGTFANNNTFAIEGGRLTLNRTGITGTGTYTAFSGAIIGGAGAITEGSVLVKAGGSVETGLTTANLTVEEGGQIAVQALTKATQSDAKPLAVTDTLTLPETTLINADAVSANVYGKVCTVLTWAGSAPETTFTLTGENKKM